MPNADIKDLYTPLYYNYYNIYEQTSIDDMEQKIQDKVVSVGKEDAVVSMFMCPLDFARTDGINVTKTFNVQHPTNGGNKCLVGGYVPRNKKLLCYPYNYFVVDVLNDSHVYRYEDFDLLYGDNEDEYKFNVDCTMSPNPEIIISPVAYRGSGGGAGNPCESVCMTGFPQVPFTIDAYRAWLGQKSVDYFVTQGSNLLSFGVGTVGLMTGIASGNPLLVAGSVGAMGSSVGNAITSARQEVLDTTKGSKARGNSDSDTLVGSREKKIYVRQLSIKQEIAESIDSFFDVYGYNVSTKKYPSRKYRAHWTYCKTANCQGYGTIPSDDLVKIKNIYNKGVTWWRKFSEVGNYNLTNSVL